MRQTLLSPLHFSLPHYATQACMLNATAYKQRQGLTLNKIIRIASYSKYENQITFQGVIICCLLHKNSVIKIRLLTLFFVKAWYIYVICQPGGPYWEKLCQRSWVRPEAAGRTQDRITCSFFSSGEYFASSFCVEFSLQPFSNLVYVWVWHLGNRKSNQHYTHFLGHYFQFTFFAVKKNYWKRRESWKICSVPYVGSVWEYWDCWGARN